MANVQQKMFAVTVLRRDEQHMILVQTPSQDEARKAWTVLLERWKTAIKEQTPFVLDNDVTATAFDPGLIYEITIKSTDLTSRFSQNNPYQNEMATNGFSNSWEKFSGGAAKQGNELLDSGFKF